MKLPLKTIIVDDERHARDGLRTLLYEYEEIEVIGEAGDVDSALKEINRLKPSVIFLDIQMPRKTGFELVDKIDPRIKVIFVTAFDEYAIRAFEVNALDYLMKPVRPERLKKTIDRLLQDEDKSKEKFKKLGYKDVLFVRFNSSMVFLNINQILFIHSAADYTEINLMNGKKGLVAKTMKEWEHRLPEDYFIRIHRSTIINLNYIKRIESWFNGKMRVYMQDMDEPLVISRRNSKLLRERMG